MSAFTTSFPPDKVPQATEDPLFGLMRAYRADKDPKKVDLGIGAYRSDDGKPWVLPVVKKADEVLRADTNLDHEYLGIAGLATMTSRAAQLMLGEEVARTRSTSFQTISGTGAVHLGAAFLARFYAGGPKTVLVSRPTWANHHQILTNVGLRVESYPYWDGQRKGLDFEGMKGALRAAEEGTIVLLHACAHNPTGVDPSEAQWQEIAEIMREKRHFPVFDSAYQGFASGDLDRDAAAVRLFAKLDFEMLVAQSFAKNLGLYGERCGCLHYVASGGGQEEETQKTTARVQSQLAILQRSEISNPPAYGARIASTVLNDEALYAEWKENLQTMSGRIVAMRKALRERLESLGTPGSWRHITDQIGMFSFTGLTPQQVAAMRQAHVYMTENGRISMAGLNTKNVDYVAETINKVVRETSGEKAATEHL